MGDSRSRYYDDYCDYRDFCDSLKVESEHDFYRHQRELLEELGLKSLYEYYQSLKTIEVRNKKINQILLD
jgi:hypothetical protein